MEGYQQDGGGGEWGNGTGSKKHNGEVKISIRNGKAKELICRTHGHELRGGGNGGGRGTWGRGK